MKKRFLALLLSLLLIGCDKTFTINQEEVQKISYDNVTILDKEYSNIINFFNQLIWKEGTLNESITNTLILTTKENVNTISITNQNHLIYQKDNQTYYSKDTSILDFIQYLNKKKQTYLDDTFYSIELQTDYEQENNDILIKLEQGNNYYVLKSEETITDFRIHELEKKDNTFEDINVLYQKELIEKRNRIIIRLKNPKENYIRITFSTSYGYEISIIPIYDEEKDEIIYQKEMKPKENS